MPSNASTFSSAPTAVEPDVVNRRAPAVLTSILVHILVLLVLPLFDLPNFYHRVVAESESVACARAEYGEQPITQVVLSATLPDAAVTTMAEQFAAKQANVVSAGGQSGVVQAVEPDSLAAIETSISSPQQGEHASGRSEFDPAGVRDSLPSRTDLSLHVPDPRLNATPLLTWTEVNSERNQEESRAIAAALRWIISQQSDTGYWPRDRRLVLVDEQVTQQHIKRVSQTSLALLPLIAMQQTHQQGKYAEKMQLAVDFLLAADPDPVTNDTEAQRALVLTELFILTRDARIRAGAKLAIDKVLATDYRPLLGQGEDYWSRRTRYYGLQGQRPRALVSSTFAWQVFAMRAGEFAGLQENTNVIPTLRINSRTPVASAYSSVDLHGSYFREEGDNLASAGCAKNGEHPRETDYFTTLFLNRTKHPAGSEWSDKTTEYLLTTQNKLYPHTGSWTADSKSDDDLTATVFATLILCVPSESTVIHRRP